MSPAGPPRKASAIAIVLATLGALFLGLLTAVPQPARAASCDQVSVITGTWNVINTQECVGIDFTLDGNLNVLSGGSLTLRGGSLSVIQETGRIYSVNIASGGTLILDGSTLKTTPQALDAYVKLDLNVNGGTLVMKNGAVMKFPGTFDATAGSTVEIRASTITGFLPFEVEPWVGGAAADDNDDAPTITWSSATVSVFKSRIERLYEASSANGTRTPVYLSGSTALTAIDSYIGVDFHNNPNVHNVIRASDTAKAYLLNVTIDELQSNLIPPADWIPPYVSVGGSTAFYLYRWADVTVRDRNGVPVEGAGVWTRQSPSGATATYPDNSNLAVPGEKILAYLGKSQGNFNVTDAVGKAVIPLISDRIDNATGNNSFFSGNYVQNATAPPPYGAFRGESSCTFSAYPLITADRNRKSVAISILGLALPRPEFTVTALTASGGNNISTQQPINTPITLRATLNNSGPLGALGVKVSFFRANVDADNDGVMDSSVAVYQSTGQWIGDATVDIGSNTSLFVMLPWTPPGGTAESNLPISAVADPPLSTPSGSGAIVEPNERNNIRSGQIAFFTWPDLDVFAVTPQRSPIVNNPTPIDVQVRNDGTNNAANARIRIFDGSGAITSAPFDLLRGAQPTTRTVIWTPSVTGNLTVRVTVLSENKTGDIRTKDYNWANNVRDSPQSVLGQPDVALRPSDYSGPPLNVTQNRAFDFAIVIHNNGQTQAVDVEVAVYLDGNLATVLNYTTGLGVPSGSNVTVVVRVAGIDAPTGSHRLMIVVDPNGRIYEGSAAAEANNFANATVDVLPPAGSIFLDELGSTALEPGTTLLTSGIVVDTSLAPLRGIAVAVTLEDLSGNPFSSATTTSGPDGFWTAQLAIPAALRDGGYRIVGRGPPGGLIEPAFIDVSVRSTLPFWFQPVPLLGMPWWMLLAIIGIVAGVGIGLSVYLRKFGLGKMVECGECGAFIPEDSPACPKCGVEFEKEMAKCSNCQAWLPVGVKQCPECGVEFATGEVEIADYQAKMRTDYDAIVRKFRDAASRELNRHLTDREFLDWWRKQPTFVTFEDWVREEEEMRKMGSKPCPTCGSLNSITATLCHKCGTLLKEEKRSPAREVPKRTQPTSEGPDSAEEPAAEPEEEPPKRVAKKPGGGSPVVRKVVRRLGEAESGDQDRSGRSADDDF